MKKSMIGCLFLFFVVTLNAQTGFSIKAGTTRSNMHGDPNQDFSGRAGFFLGFYTSIPLTKKLSIEPGLTYAQKGAIGQGDMRFAFFIRIPKYKLAARYDMVEIPLLANLKITRSFHLLAGPQVSFLTSARLKHYVYVDAYQDPNKYDETPDDEIGTRIYAGLVVVATYKLWRNISGMIQYDMDLNNHVFYGGNAKNTTLRMGINYRLR